MFSFGIFANINISSDFNALSRYAVKTIMKETSWAVQMYMGEKNSGGPFSIPKLLSNIMYKNTPYKSNRVHHNDTTYPYLIMQPKLKVSC
jgi:hypothetical protein